MTLLAFDRSPDSARTIDVDGRMHVANCPISKAMVCPYYGSEIPGWQELGLERTRKYMMLRPPEELEAAASTFNNIQVLVRHTAVSADDPKQTDVGGTTGTDTFFDGTYLRTTLTLWTQEAIDDVENEETAELSASYLYTPIMEAGTFEGLRYDGRMVNIVANHVALVEQGRAGPDVHVSDSLPKGFRMKKSFLLRTVRGLANDADIDGEELLAIITAAGAAGAGADDDDLNDDPNVSAGEIPEGVAAFLSGKLNDDEMGELAKCFAPKADDADPDDDDSADDADPDGDDDDQDGEPKDKDRASDAAPRGRAFDAAAFERRIIGRMTAWNTACEKVAPHIGRVKLAMDAAPDGARGLYRKALDAHKISHAGISSTAALAAMVDMLPKPTAGFASDAAHSSAPSPLDDVLKGTRPVHRS